MTVAELRADADRREALARNATHHAPWVADHLNVWSPACPVTPREYVVARMRGPLAQAARNAQHIAAHDPAAALASVERDRLLADFADWAARDGGLLCSCGTGLYNHQDRFGNRVPTEQWHEAGISLLRRFAALEAK